MAVVGSSSAQALDARPATPKTTNNSQSPTKRALAVSPETSPQAKDKSTIDAASTTSTTHAVDSPRLARTKLESGEVAIRASSCTRRAAEQDEEQLRGSLSSTPPAEDDVFGSKAMVGLGVGGVKVAPPPAVGGGLSAKESADRQTKELREMDPELGARLSKMCSQYVMSDYNNMKRYTQAGLTAPLPAMSTNNHFTSLPPPPTLQRAHSSPPMPPPAASPALISAPLAPVKTNDVEIDRQAITVTSVPLAPPTLLAPVPTRPAIARAATGWSNILRTAGAALGSASTSQAVTPTEDVSREGTPSAQFATPPRGREQLGQERTSLTPALTSLSFGDQRKQEESKNDAEVVKTTLDSSAVLLKQLRDAQEEEPADEVTSATAVQSPLSTLPPMPPMDSIVGGVHLLPGMKMMNGVAVRTSASHPMNISPIVPPEMLSILGAAILANNNSANSRSASPLPQRTPLAPSSAHNSPALGPTRSGSIKKRPSSGTPFILAPNPNGDLHSLVFQGPSPGLFAALHDGNSHLTNKGQSIGQFYLSSCPGKKVRLDGSAPRGGRSAICRDVRMDLARAKAEGVRVVICCLEDSELAFLGAPWEEYSNAAASLGLAVVRIPMVEGFAPASPAELDALMDGVIRQHTLRGESVLAHCRGGIGRAGLVACAWMLKMGFVWQGEGEVPRGREGIEGWGDEWAVVERTIELIRSRRSVKAIETAQQVNFLLKYVGWLKENAQVVGADTLA